MFFDEFLEGVRFLFNPTTEMHIAAFHGDTKKVKMLLENGADVNVVDGDGSTPLHMASHGQTDTVYEILNHKPQVNIRDIWNQTPLHILVSNGPYNLLMVDHYLEHGADPNTQDINGHAILHIMACFPLEEMHAALNVMKFLVRRGADINLTSKRGNTPLHVAARYGFVEIVEFLLKYNANMYLKNSENETPIDIALTLTSPYVLDCLGKHLLVKYGLTEKVNEEYFKKILEINRLQDFWKQCTIELDQLKKDKVGDTVFSYYHLMTLSPYKMSKLFRNCNTAASILCYEWETFKIFGQHLYDNWITAKIRSQKLSNAYLFFSIVCPWMPELVVDKITSFLDDDDFCVLIYAIYHNGYRTSQLAILE